MASGGSRTGCAAAGAASSSAGLVSKPWLGHAVRAALFVMFVWYVYGARFAPSREQPFEDAETTVRAANAGLPFQLAYPGSDAAPPSIKRMSDVYGDYGILLIVSLTGSAGRTLFGPSF